MFEFSKNSPIHSQIYDDIISKLISGLIDPDSKMESIRSLAHYYSVNPNTVQRVISDLEREDIVGIKRGIGTIVSDKSTIQNLRENVLNKESYDYVEKLYNMGFNSVQILDSIKGCLLDGDK